MILRSSLYGLGFVLIYIAVAPCLFRRLGSPVNPSVTLRDSNLIKTEDFSYHEQAWRLVLLGSSITASVTDLPSDWFNLGIRGGSVLTGIRLVLARSVKPREVLIETNYIDRPMDGNTLDWTDSFFGSQLRRRIEAFKKTHRPSELFFHFVSVARTHGISGLSARLSGAVREVAVVKKSPEILTSQPDVRDTPHEIFSTLFDGLLKTDSVPMVPDLLNTRMAELKNGVKLLEAQGVKVSFIEFPEAPERYSLVRNVQKRSLMLEAFPQEKYRWITIPDRESYNTKDGVHLTEVSGARFKKYLLDTF